MDARDVAIVLLAAGNARRFGSDKLIADLSGLPLGVHAARTLKPVNAVGHFAVCQPQSHIRADFEALDFTVIDNGNAALGLSTSLQLAVEAAAQTQAKAVLITLADMPFVTIAHIEALIAACESEIIASSDNGQAMPPAIFPRSTWSTLLEASGDAGARHILANAKTLAAPEGSLRDIDTPDDLAASKAHVLGIDPGL